MISIEEKYKMLVRLLTRAEVAYYNTDRPLMCDSDYDKNYSDLLAIEVARPDLIAANSPSRRVGGKPTKEFKNVQHSSPMLSLDNVVDQDGTDTFLKAVSKIAGQLKPTFVLEPKIDGLSLSLLYQDGMLVRAATRGDGVTGDDVTENVKTIRSVPIQLHGKDVPSVVEVRGEVYMRFDVFNALNAELKKAGEEVLANTRNASVGALKKKDPKECAKRKLSFLAYQVVTPDTNSHLDSIKLLSSFGFAVPVNVVCDSASVWEEVNRFDALRKTLPYLTDGTVVKLNEHALRAKLGAHTKAPRWAAAMKLQNNQVQAKVKSVTWQVGKTGVVAPVAEIEPILLDGSVISRATLSNQSEIARKDIRVGDTVLLQKAGQVIPEIVSSILELRQENSRQITTPVNCPCCNTPLRPVLNSDGKPSAAIYCSNTIACQAQLMAKMEHWASKGAMDIDGLGGALVEKLWKMGVFKPSELYRLQLRQLLDAKIGPTVSANLIAAIEASRHRGLEKLLVALCIPSVGAGTAKRLAKHYKDIDSVWMSSAEEMRKVPDVGNVTIRDIMDWFSIDQNISEVVALLAAGVDDKSKTFGSEVILGALNDQTFVITGDLEAFSREEAHAKIESLGGRATGSVSKKTTYLVVGVNAGNTKLNKARSLGTRILNETEFIAMLG